VQEDGSDWRTVRVVDVQNGKVLDDRLDWANDTQIGWIGDEGFLYSRFPQPAAGEEYRAPPTTRRSGIIAWARRRPRTNWSMPRPIIPNGRTRPW
jgi:prolyl oligopeptidase PreP (S9A serine peptidase family)